MAILLWDPEGSGDSLYGELVELRRDIQKYRAAILPEEVQQLVHAAAMNPEVSGEVIAKVKKELHESHNKYFRLLVRAAMLCSVSVVLAIAVELLQTFIHDNPWLLTAIAWMLLIAAIEFYYLRYFEWRANNSDSYIAHFLIRAMEFGLKYQEDPSSQYLRDGLARLIQQVAIRYTIIYKRSNGTRFFVKQVRGQAARCRSNIISLVPGLVTASRDEIE